MPQGTLAATRRSKPSVDSGACSNICLMRSWHTHRPDAPSSHTPLLAWWPKAFLADVISRIIWFDQYSAVTGFGPSALDFSAAQNADARSSEIMSDMPNPSLRYEVLATHAFDNTKRQFSTPQVANVDVRPSL